MKKLFVPALLLALAACKVEKTGEDTYKVVAPTPAAKAAGEKAKQEAKEAGEKLKEEANKLGDKVKSETSNGTGTTGTSTTTATKTETVKTETTTTKH